MYHGSVSVNLAQPHSRFRFSHNLCLYLCVILLTFVESGGCHQKNYTFFNGSLKILQFENKCHKCIDKNVIEYWQKIFKTVSGRVLTE